MATFWTGAALAADYTHNRIRVLGEDVVSHYWPAQCKIDARREALQCFNRAIISAIEAQFDEQQSLSCLAEGDDDWLMHCDGMACIYPPLY